MVARQYEDLIIADIDENLQRPSRCTFVPSLVAQLIVWEELTDNDKPLRPVSPV